MSWKVPVPATVEVHTDQTPEIETLSLLTGDAETPSHATIQLGVKVDGVWHEAAAIPPLRLQDDPDAPPSPPFGGVSEVSGEQPETSEIPSPPSPQLWGEPEGGGGQAADPPTEPPGQAKKTGQEMADAILTAKIYGNTPLAQQFNIPNGTPLAEALPQIAWGLLYPAPPASSKAPPNGGAGGA